MTAGVVNGGTIFSYWFRSLTSEPAPTLLGASAHVNAGGYRCDRLQVSDVTILGVGRWGSKAWRIQAMHHFIPKITW